MIKPAALLMGILMTAISSGTYFGLDLLSRGLPPPIGRAVAADAPAAPAPVTVVAVTPVATAPPAPAAEPAAVEAVAAPAAEPAAAAAAVEEAPAAAPAVEEAPAAAPPAEAAAATPAPAPAEAPAAAPAPPAETARAASASAPSSAPAADAIKPWWPDPAQMPANQLKLQYAGQVKGQDAIALLFSAPLNLDTLQQHASVRSASGEAVAGTWSLGRNPKLAVLGGLAPGRYTVILAPQVADQKGFMLGATLTGPVYVKEP